MNRFVIMTDSSCDLTQEVFEQRGIANVMLTVDLDGKDYVNYADWREIDPHAFYDELRAGTDRLSELSKEMTRQYSDIYTGFKELTTNNKAAKRLLLIYSSIIKAAEDTLKDIENIWKDVKSFFTDTDNESK